MRRTVIKLGSSIVAEDDGELRGEVLARICDAVVALHAAGEEVVVVSSGAIATGIRVMNLPARPAAISELQAASAPAARTTAAAAASLNGVRLRIMVLSSWELNC